MTIERSWSPAPQHITLESLFRPRDKFCFLAGSGISLDSPSSLPTGYQFTRALIRRLIPEEERDNILELMNPKREGMKNSEDFLRFEGFMEILRWFDVNLHVLDIYIEQTTPNLNHLFLAQMLNLGHSILTTNFDSLIEYAILESGIPRKQIFPVIHKQDWEAQPKPNDYPVYKLHGSLIDVRHRIKQDSRETIQSILKQITQRKGELFQLEFWKQRVLRSIFQDYDLLILGYSGLDDFDILPTFWTIPSPKRILWISHDSNITLTEAQIEVIEDKVSSQPSEASPHLNRIKKNLLQFALYETRQSSQLVHIKVHTGKLLEWLWERYIHSPQPTITSPPSTKKWVLSDYLVLSEAEKWFLTAELFETHQLSKKSIHAYQNALDLVKKERNRKLHGKILNNIGLLLHAQ